MKYLYELSIFVFEPIFFTVVTALLKYPIFNISQNVIIAIFSGFITITALTFTGMLFSASKTVEEPNQAKKYIILFQTAFFIIISLSINATIALIILYENFSSFNQLFFVNVTYFTIITLILLIKGIFISYRTITKPHSQIF